MAEDYPDVVISLRWGGKDGKWRWLAETLGKAWAGEERDYDKAVAQAAAAAKREVYPGGGHT